MIYRYQKSLDVFILLERSSKNLAFAQRSAVTVVTLFLAVVYLVQDFLVLSFLAV